MALNAEITSTQALRSESESLSSSRALDGNVSVNSIIPIEIMMLAHGEVKRISCFHVN